MSSWHLSTVDMNFLVEALSLPPLPYPLGAPSPGMTFDERRRLVERVRADLANRGLTSDGTLGDALVLLAFGEVVIDGRLTAGGEVDLVGAVRDDLSALVVRTDATVRVDLVDACALTDVIVGLLPATPQPPGNPATVPHEALARALAASDSRDLERLLADADAGDTDARLLADLLRTDDAARFGVAARAPATDAYRDRRVWTWYASAAGGVLVSHDSDEAPTSTTLVPAAPARVGRCLSDALCGLRHGGVRNE